ncbi:1-phosphofructokinase family hexose kinase [Defluviimonas aestuarii]|uniref:1-phosphofructokinase family hexose kinase n=1 Tax=Albidovulum aestuarii TaxID=1130726 RepID=UPI00249B5169|nr:1-phosphofructokinase family hexose kinase [Defluviimonas aestuarii]MDI3335606.1 1-phosphofructokinase family hexose kinase [Defluviimonas aestuarii]
MTPILTVTLNPALDIATATDGVRPGPKLRCDTPQVDPGGGGINVSRVIARLGGVSTTFVALGGATGERLSAALAVEKIAAHPYPAPGETRESLSVTDRATGAQYRFVLPGPVWTQGQGKAVLTAIADAAPEGALVVLSGSLPPGLPVDLPARLTRSLTRKAARLVLDTSGATLIRAADPVRSAHVLRMDEAEAEALAGGHLKTRGDSADFAEALVRRGAARIAVIARGADGSVLATERERWFAKAAKVPVKSKVGAGDSFLAAFTLALAHDRALPRALQEGMAAASAAVMTEATELCRRADFRRLVKECPVEPV